MSWKKYCLLCEWGFRQERPWFVDRKLHSSRMIYCLP